MHLRSVVLPVLALISFSSQAAESLNHEQKLGEHLFKDVNLSLNRNQSCVTCHSLNPANGGAPAPGFVDPDNVNNGTAVSAGSIANVRGALNAPSLGYAAFSPDFYRNKKEGLYMGGQFWNGRARGLKEQAREPFLNPREMAMPDISAVVERIKEEGEYHQLFWNAYKVNLEDTKWGSFPDTGKKPADDKKIFALAARAIAEFEKTTVFNRFNSKFDYVLAGKTTFTAKEEEGLQLFNGKAQCSACHISEATPFKSEGTHNKKGKIMPPLFTDFTYDNIGLPRNAAIPDDPDRGLGGRADIAAKDPDGNELGKHKVMTLRNIALTPPYGHNGVLVSLKQVVHFYNTRDTLGVLCTDNADTINFGITGWPLPEIQQNVNVDELGDLKLTSEEEDAIVAFMETLTDDYPIWGNDPNVPMNSPPPFPISP